jgi:iron-sulfur cluster repair protein YtfE (RIC family)
VTLLDCSWSVNETIARYPETLSVFNSHGVDTCCGGTLSVHEAAERERVDASALCDALTRAVVAARS